MRAAHPLLLALACYLAAAVPGVQAQDAYPRRPVRVIVPNAAGGSIDQVLRAIAERIEPVFGQPFVIDNRSGASGAIGAELAKAAPPDGYTLLAGSTSTNTITPNAQSGARYDGVRDFLPVINIAYTTKMVSVNPSVPAHTLRELIAYARAHPGVLNYISTGVGSSSQLDSEMFAERAGIRITHVPYRSPAAGIMALVAGDVQLSLSSITTTIGAVRAGTVRALAVIADCRSPLLPDVPTIAEAGMPDLDIRTWIGLVAPLGTPPAVISRLNTEINAALAEPAMRHWMAQQGWEPIGGSSAAFAQTLASDNAKWAAEIRKLGLRQ